MAQRKILIFDFDGTLYSGENIFSAIPEFIKNNRRKILSRLTDDEYNKIVSENPTWNEAWYGNDLAKHIHYFKKKYPNLNISIRDLLSWENSCIEPVNINAADIVDTKFLKTLCKNNTVYIVSNSLHNHLRHYMKIMGIDFNWFKGVFSNHFMEKDISKKPYYTKIMNLEKCKPQEMYIFGDSNRSDLVPARELGMNAFEIVSALDIPKIVNQQLSKN